MLNHYLTIALRNLTRDKGYSLVNIFGLPVGLPCCVLIFLFIRHEWTYDTFHDNAPTIYRVLQITTESSGDTVVWASAPGSPGPNAPGSVPWRYRHCPVSAVGRHFTLWEQYIP